MKLFIPQIAVALLFLLSITPLQAQKTWNGSQSSNWFTDANWTPAGVPDLTLNVTIPAQAAVLNTPVLSAGAAVCRSLTLSANALFEVSGGALTTATNQFLSIQSGAVLHQTGGDITIVRDINLLAGGTYLLEGGTISTTRNFNVSGTLTHTNGTLQPALGLNIQNGGVWTKTGGSALLRNLTGANTSTININGNVELIGNFNVNNPATFVHTNGRFLFNGTTVNQGITGTHTFWDLEIANDPARLVFLNNQIFVANDLYLTQGRFAPGTGTGSFTLTVNGNWYSNGAVFTPNFGQVIFGGNEDKQITGTSTNATTFYDLVLAKTSGLEALTTTFKLRLNGSLEVQLGEFLVNPIAGAAPELDVAVDVRIVQGGLLYLNNTNNTAPNVRLRVGRNLLDYSTNAGARTGAVASSNGLKFRNRHAIVEMASTNGAITQSLRGFAPVQAQNSGNNMSQGLLLPRLEVRSASTVFLENDGVRVLGEGFVMQGILRLNGRTLIIGGMGGIDNTAANNNLDFTVGQTGTLDCDANSRLLFASRGVDENSRLVTDGVGGTIRLVGGGDDSPVLINRDNPPGVFPYYRIRIRNGGTLAARFYIVNLIQIDGIYMEQGSILDPANNLSNGTFNETRSGSTVRFIQLHNNLPDSTVIENVKFNFTSAAINVTRPNTVTGRVVMKNCSGVWSGPQFEDDAADGTAQPRAIPNLAGLVWWITESEDFFWTGAENHNWYEPLNWSTGVVPGGVDNAIIPTVTRYPILEADVSINDLLITATPAAVNGEVFNTNGRSLTVNGSLIKSGTNGRFNHPAGGTLSVATDFTFPDVARFNAATSSWTNFIGSTSLQRAFTFANLRVQGTLFINNSSRGITCDTIRLSSGVLSYVNFSAWINVRQSWINDGGDFSHVGGSVRFVSADGTLKTILSNGVSFGTAHFLPEAGGTCTYRLLDDMQCVSPGNNNATNGWSVFLHTQTNATRKVTLDLNGKRLLANNIRLRSQGVADGSHLLLSPNSILAIGDGYTLTTEGNQTSRITFVGDSANRVRVTNQGTGTYSITLTAANLLSARFADFEYMDTNGVNVTGSTIDAVNNFSNCGFSNLTGAAGTLLRLPDQSLPEIRNTRFFISSSPVPGTHFNVFRGAAGSGPAIFIDAKGNMAGEIYEQDNTGATNPGNIEWDDTPGITVYWGPFASGNWHDEPSKWRDINGNLVPVPSLSQNVIIDHRFEADTIRIGATSAVFARSLVMNSATVPIVVNFGSQSVSLFRDFDMYSNRDTLKHSGNFFVGGSWSSFAGNYVPEGLADLRFNGNAGTFAARPGSVFRVVRLTAATRTLRLQTPLRVSNGLFISSGTLDVGDNHMIEIRGGNLTMNGGTFVSRGGTVLFTGPVNQSITNTNGQRFFNLELQKPGGNLNLGNNIFVEGSLIFRASNTARIITTALNSVRMGVGANSVGVNPNGTNGYVDGKMSYMYSSAAAIQTRNYTVGKFPDYLPFELGVRLSFGTPTEILGEQFNTAPSVLALPLVPEEIVAHSSAHHFHVNNLTGTPIQNAVISISYNADDFNSMWPTDPSVIRLLKSNSDMTEWINLSPLSGGAIGNELGGFVTSTLNWTTFSEFVVSTLEFVPLPVENLRLRADYQPEAHAIAVNWTTEGERNNAGFAVERSLNPAEGFELMDSYQSNPQLVGAGNADGLLQYNWLDAEANLPGATYYYRLRQIDYDGQMTLSPVVQATVPMDAGRSEVRVYPNPVRDEATFAVMVPRESHLQLAIYDLHGRLVTSLHNGPAEAGLQTFRWLPDGLAPGIYTWRLQTESDSQSGKLLLNR